MNFIQRTPFFGLLLALVSGIMLHLYANIPVPFLLFSFAASFLALLLLVCVRNAEMQYRFRRLYPIAGFLCVATIGYGLCVRFDRQNQFSELNRKTVYEVEIITAPVAKPRSYAFRAKLLQRYDSLTTTAVRGKAMLYVQKDSLPFPLLLGDRMLIEAEFKPPDGVQNPHGFDYARYLKRQGVGATAFVGNGRWRKLDREPDFSIRRIANISRNHLLDIYRKYRITDHEFAVLAALTLGFTDSLEPEIYKVYSSTGAVHIICVSGLHVGIVYVAIFWLLGFLNRNRKQKAIRSLVSVLFVWIYATITGLSPSVMRAAIMLTFVAFGSVTERKPQIYNSIFASAFCILLFQPALIFNIGFQLSYSAVLSIVFFQPKIARLLAPKNKPLKWLWGLTAVSVAAQIGTAPAVIYYFQQFPNYFLLTNYIAIPLSTGIIYLSILLFVVSFVPAVATWVALALKWSIWLMNYLLMWLMQLPGSLAVVSITEVELALALAAIIAFSAFVLYKRFGSLAIGLGLVLLFFIHFATKQYNSLKTSQFIVFSDSRTPVINFIDGKKNYVHARDELQALNTGSAYWRSSLRGNPQFITQNEWFQDGFALFRGKRILILEDDFLKNKTTTAPIAVDYLILTNRLKPRMDDILRCVIPQQIIVDKSISAWYTHHVKEACEANGIAFYSVAEKGAYLEKITN